jgi:4-hydroxy-tetrahydrodipicolinate synthase
MEVAMATGPFAGVLAPVITPFNADLSVNRDRFVALCKNLLHEGCTGLVPFGTTGEAWALSLAEKQALLAGLAESEVPAARLMPGTGLCARPETVALTREAVGAGCGGVLLLPPFFLKKVSDEGLYRYAAEVIEQVGDPRLNVYLYHIPPVAGVGWSPDLVARLARAYPETVVGLKDSSGDPAYTREVLRRLPNFGAFTGNERYLVDTLERGGAGTISASANHNAALIRRLYERWDTGEGTDLNDAVSALRRTLDGYPTIAATKAVRARKDGDPELMRVRPPVTALDAGDRDELYARLDQLAVLTNLG